MAELIKSPDEIPHSFAYVLADDTWDSDDRTNVIIVPVDDNKEMATVEQNLRRQDDMANVRVVHVKPKMFGGFTYSLFNHQSGRRWYESS